MNHRASMGILLAVGVLLTVTPACRAGIECISVYCACDPPGVYRPCNTDCAALCAGKGAAAGGGGGVDYRHQLMMDATSTLVQGFLDSFFSSNTANYDAYLAEERRRLAEEEARRRAEEERIAEERKQRLLSELKGYSRVELAYKRDARAGGPCRDGLSDEAFDLAINGGGGDVAASSGVRRITLTAFQSRTFDTLRKECQMAALDNGKAQQALRDAKAGMVALKHAVSLAQKRESASGGADEARRTREETEAYATKVTQNVRDAQARAIVAETRVAEARARQHQFACDPTSKVEKDDWCATRARPLKPAPSILKVGQEDERRWADYVARMKEWCPRCEPDDAECVPANEMPGRHPEPEPGDSLESQGPFGKDDAGCGEGFLTGPAGGDFFYCCPEGYPYLSRCDHRCYSADAFNGKRIQCESSWAGTVQCQ